MFLNTNKTLTLLIKYLLTKRKILETKILMNNKLYRCLKI